MKNYIILFFTLILGFSNLNFAQEKTQNLNQAKPILKKERTLAIIKPDAIEKKLTGEIIKLIELNGFETVKFRKLKLSKKNAQKFYSVHKDRPFYNDLVNYMSSGSVVVLMLEKTNAVADWRKLMGATNPENAEVGSIRKMFGTSIQENAVHGSDSEENAIKELRFFFKVK